MKKQKLRGAAVYKKIGQIIHSTSVVDSREHSLDLTTSFNSKVNNDLLTVKNATLKIFKNHAKMTSAHTSDDVNSSATNVKALNNNKTKSRILNGDDIKAFINVSHENLTISQFDIEQGFNKNCPCGRMYRQNLFSVVCAVLLIFCIVAEAFLLARLLDNSREIQALKEQLEILKKPFYEDHVLDDLKAFEEQLYADGMEHDDTSEDTEDDSDTDDRNYEDYSDSSSHDYIGGLPDTIAPCNTSSTTNSSENGNKTTSRRRRYISEDPPVAYTSDGRPIYARDHTKSEESPDDSNSEVIMEEMPKKEPKIRYLHVPIPFRYPRPTSEEQRRIRRQVEEPEGSLRRHGRQWRHVAAAHYGADTTMFHEEDEHVGNGKACHGRGVFKAWRAADWMNEYAMNRHFSLVQGTLTVNQAGLYLIYAQIHYLDEHDENGFRVLVNSRPILQCMLYSPGTGHKSRSCFSASVALLHVGDQVILKDVGESRYTLFQRDKSFFGLVKVADLPKPFPARLDKPLNINFR